MWEISSVFVYLGIALFIALSLLQSALWCIHNMRAARLFGINLWGIGMLAAFFLAFIAPILFTFKYYDTKSNNFAGYMPLEPILQQSCMEKYSGIDGKSIKIHDYYDSLTGTIFLLSFEKEGIELGSLIAMERNIFDNYAINFLNNAPIQKGKKATISWEDGLFGTYSLWAGFNEKDGSEIISTQSTTMEKKLEKGWNMSAELISQPYKHMIIFSIAIFLLLGAFSYIAKKIKPYEYDDLKFYEKWKRGTPIFELIYFDGEEQSHA